MERQKRGQQNLAIILEFQENLSSLDGIGVLCSRIRSGNTFHGVSNCFMLLIVLA